MRLGLRRGHEIVSLLSHLLGPRRRAAKWSAEQRADLRRHSKLPWGENIVGVSVGGKLTAGESIRKLAIRFYVLRKVGLGRVSKAERIPPELYFESLGLEGILTDVESLPHLPLAHVGLAPGGGLAPGAPIAHFSGTAGSAGVFAKTAGGQNCILSCSHVLARSGRANRGEPVESPVDANSNLALHAVGTLADFAPLAVSGCNPHDAAIAIVNPGVVFSAAIPGVGQPTRIRDLTPAELVTNSRVVVRRFGAATGPQNGIVAGAIGCFQIGNLPGFGSTAVTIGNLVPYRTTAAAGDSGAPVLEAGTTTLLGIHIAGAGSLGFFQAIRPIIQRFNLRL